MSWDEITQSEEWKDYCKRVREGLIPKVKDSSLVVSIVPAGEIDIKFAIELGMAVMMDKPIVAVIPPGTPVPEKLARVVDRFVELDFRDPTQRERLAETLKEMVEEGLGEDDES